MVDKCRKCKHNINKIGELGMCNLMMKFVSQEKIHPRCPLLKK